MDEGQNQFSNLILKIQERLERSDPSGCSLRSKKTNIEDLILGKKIWQTLKEKLENLLEKW